MAEQSPEPNRTERPAAATRSEQARTGRNKVVATSAGIVAVLAVVVAAGFWLSNGSDPVTGSKAPRVVLGENSLVVGNNPDAKVKVVVYEDFLCPYCRRFENASRDFLHADAAEGRVLVEYRPFQLLHDGYSTRALSAWGAVLERGTPAQALRFHDLLYDNQPQQDASDKPGTAKLMALAKQAGVKQSVLDTFATADSAFYASVQKAAQRAKVSSAPMILVNGEPLRGSSLEAKVSDLEKQIASS